MRSSVRQAAALCMMITVGVTAAARGELLVRRILAAVRQTCFARCPDDFAAIDLSGRIDRQRHHLAAEQLVAGLHDGLTRWGFAEIEAALEGDRIVAVVGGRLFRHFAGTNHLAVRAAGFRSARLILATLGFARSGHPDGDFFPPGIGGERGGDGRGR